MKFVLKNKFMRRTFVQTADEKKRQWTTKTFAKKCRWNRMEQDFEFCVYVLNFLHFSCDGERSTSIYNTNEGNSFCMWLRLYYIEVFFLLIMIQGLLFETRRISGSKMDHFWDHNKIGCFTYASRIEVTYHHNSQAV